MTCGKERKSQVCAGGVPEESVVAALDTEGAPGAAAGPLLFAEPVLYTASCQFSGLPSALRRCGSPMKTWAGGGSRGPVWLIPWAGRLRRPVAVHGLV